MTFTLSRTDSADRVRSLRPLPWVIQVRPNRTDEGQWYADIVEVRRTGPWSAEGIAVSRTTGAIYRWETTGRPDRVSLPASWWLTARVIPATDPGLPDDTITYNGAPVTARVAWKMVMEYAIT